MSQDMEMQGVVTRSKSKKQNEVFAGEERRERETARNTTGNAVEEDKLKVSSQIVSRAESKPKSKSHFSKHSKSSSAKIRKILEAQILADEQIAKVLAAEQDIETQKQEMVKRKLEHERRMIQHKLALQEAIIEGKGSDEDSRTSKDSVKVDLEVPEDMLSERSKVNNWLMKNNTVERQDSYYSTSMQENFTRENKHKQNTSQDMKGSLFNHGIDGNDIRTILARQTIDKDLPIFTGNVKDWPSFINQYDTTTRLLGLSSEENICRLRKCLKGDARRAVDGLLISSSCLSKIIEILRNRFGRPELIVRSLVNEARNLSYVKQHDFSSLTNFSDVIQNLVATLEVLKMQNYLSCPQLLHELLQKLPYSLQLSWGKNMAKKRVDPSLKDFQKWIWNEAESASYIQSLTTTKPVSYTQGQRGKYNATLVTSTDRNPGIKKKRVECGFCKAEHEVETCYKFKRLTADDKWKFVKSNNMCFSCLKAFHRITACTRKRKCGIENCEKYHHTLLHNEKFEKKQEAKAQEETQNITEEVIAHTSKVVQNKVLLRVAPVTIKSGTKEMEIFALFDEASTITLIDEELAQEMELEGEEIHLGLKWTSKESRKEIKSKKVCFSIAGEDKQQYELDNVHTLKSMDLPIQTVNAKKFKHKWKHLEKVNFATYENVTPKLLIGQDHWDLIATREIIEGPKNSPALSRTKLGWVLHGNIQQYKGRIDDTILYTRHQDLEHTDELHNLVKYFFSTEALGVKIPDRKIMSKEDEKAVALIETVTRRIGDRWETGLLWKDENLMFPNTMPVALQRLKYMEKKMMKDCDFAESYGRKIQEYLEKGYARRVLDEEVQETKDRIWYIPHFAVTNENKPGKTRFVFDAAAKVENLSLNDLLLKGPDLFNSLLGIIMKFREKPVAFSADIKEMFHQVKIRKEDQTAQRFLWNDTREQEMPSVYAMEVMIFGAVCSPYAAQYVKNKNAMEFQEKYPKAVEAIIHKHYMDDYLDSVSSEEEAIRLVKQVIMIHQKGGFELRGWTSNSKTLLNQIPSELRNTEEMLTNEHILPSERILGLKWDPNEDVLYFPLSFHKVEKRILTGEKNPTKREVLKVVMSIYDPLGLLGQYVIRGKIILQDTWRSGINWDDEITGKIQKKWLSWLNCFNQIEKLRVPRCYCIPIWDSLQLHIFCDASEQAFGSVGYFRFENVGKVQVCLVMSKTQVAPLRPMSIPRLELQSALMASRMAENIKKEHSFTIQKTFFWSDSKTVLCWIRSEASKFKTFVAHRVGEIQERCDARDWYWVPTKTNVADELTRDEENINMNINSRWYNGPEFLYLPYKDWPKENNKEIEESKIQYLEKKEEFVLLNNYEEIGFLPNMYIFSNWMSLMKSTAIVLKFIRLCRKEEHETKITRRNIEEVENIWYKKIQEDSYRKDICSLRKGKVVDKSSKLYQLTPILVNNLICLGGRTDNSSDLLEETKKPIILDSKHFVTKLLIQHYHNKSGHSGVELVLNEIRQKFWIIQARKAIKASSKYCPLCSIRRAMPRIPLMGQLPKCRLTKPSSQRPFTYTGVDYFGPYEVMIGRRREKRYGVVFTCLSIRAVHIELAELLTTDSALLAIRRFISRRGQPKMMYSDNGTNFHAAEKELKRCFKELNQETIEKELYAQEIEWKFIPPASPHMGGAWERMVRSIKTTLRIILRERVPRLEVLQTLIIEAEHIVNSRPLTYVSSSAEDPESLTPNHFLIGTSSNAKPPGLFDKQEWNLRKQWRISQSLTENFWSRWVKEYIPTLTKRTKWFQQNHNLKVNDLVVIMDNKLPRNNWPLGKVTKVFTGSDGCVRVADVKIKTGIYRRPITKICTVECLEMGEEPE